MKHTSRTAITRTDDGFWVAICYPCEWHGDYHRTYTAAYVDHNAHAREAKR